MTKSAKELACEFSPLNEASRMNFPLSINAIR
jgi:hypothetical protein